MYFVLGEKPNKCPICGKGFIQRVALKYHLKTKHNSEEKMPPGRSPGLYFHIFAFCFLDCKQELSYKPAFYLFPRENICIYHNLTNKMDY
jgi:hypothetical protein